MSARIGVGISAARPNMAALRGLGWLDAACDELTSDVLGRQVVAGDPAGEEPVGGAAGVGSLAATSELVDDQAIEGCGQLDSEGVEGNRDQAVAKRVDLVRSHAANARQRRRKQQHEEAGHAGVETEAVVMEQRLDIGPPLASYRVVSASRACCDSIRPPHRAATAVQRACGLPETGRDSPDRGRAGVECLMRRDVHGVPTMGLRPLPASSGSTRGSRRRQWQRTLH